MRRHHRLGAFAAVALLGGCGGGDEALYCPRVDAVAGLDRLALPYPGASERVETRLDVIDRTCVEDDGDLLVGSVVAIRLGNNRPPGEVRVPYTLVIDTPDETRGERAAVAAVPAGASGIYEYYEHRFEGLAGRDDVPVRLLYALVPDAGERERIAAERPRP